MNGSQWHEAHHIHKSKMFQPVLKHSKGPWKIFFICCKCFNTCKNTLLKECITSVVETNCPIRFYDSYGPAASSSGPEKTHLMLHLWCQRQSWKREEVRKSTLKAWRTLKIELELRCTDWSLTAGFGGPDLLCVSFLNIQGALLQPCWATKRERRKRRKRQESTLLFAATLQVGLR